MATTQYIGARYIPIHKGLWNAQTQYSALDVVLYTDGNSYTAKCASPAGTLPTNEQYWSLSSNFSQQFADLSSKVDDFAAKTARYKGYFTNETALKQMHPTGETGDFAVINSTESVWYWDGVKWLDTFTNYYNKTQVENGFFQNGLLTYGGSTDFNDIQKAGSYWFATSSWSKVQNGPNTLIQNIYSYGTIIVTRNFLDSLNSSITQIYLPHHTSGNVVFRIGGSDGRSWRDWQKIGKGLTADEVGAFAKSQIIPIANGGTGANSVASARNALGLGNTAGALPIANGGTGETTLDGYKKAQGLLTRTVVQQTNQNGEITVNIPEYANNAITAVATVTPPATSIVQKDPVQGRVIFVVYNGSQPLQNTNVRVNFICGLW